MLWGAGARLVAIARSFREIRSAITVAGIALIFTFVGLKLHWYGTDWGLTTILVVIGIAALAVLLLVFRAEFRKALPSYRSYRRRRNGLCTSCGYDLRATPERCPECGMI